jgi:hypothetical protein
MLVAVVSLALIDQALSNQLRVKLQVARRNALPQTVHLGTIHGGLAG